MIINNYNNTLKENVETSLSFHSHMSPRVSVRDFEHNLVVGDHLILPYYVSDSDQREYRDTKVGPTFTTIIRIDEDTVPDTDVVETRNTTYAGEQIIDLGEFTETGVHSFSIRTIQSNGVSSATKYFRFIVRIPESDKPILDFSTGTGFTGEFDNYTWYTLEPDPGGTTIRNVSSASYSVTSTKSNGNITSIQIQVTNGDITRNVSANAAGDAGSSFAARHITGTYNIVTTCQVNGTTVQLSDYLGVRKEELPDEVMLAAANNKVALTRLFEAAKAYFEENKEEFDTNHGIFKMPKMDIVCDYRNHTGGTAEDTVTGRDDVLFPNEITIDFNDSTISMLMNGKLDESTPSKPKYFKGGRVFHLLNNFDTHLRNCNLVGNWKNYNFKSGHEGESLHLLTLDSCKFCTIDNFDISFALGYETHIAGWSVNPGVITYRAKPFTDFGYIDYNGNAVTYENDYRNTDLENTTGLMYTEESISIETQHVPLCGSTFRIFKDGVDVSNKHRQQVHELFVHYYDDNGDFIKTVKVMERWPVFYPYGAKRIRLTAYGDKYFPGSLDNLNKSDGWAYLSRDIINTSWCTGIYNSKLHDTRSCILDNGGVQTVVDSCIFWNIGGERNGTVSSQDQYYITKLLSDFEDKSNNMFNHMIRNCEFLYGDTRAFNFKYGYDTQIVNCRNLGFVNWHDVFDGYIGNCSGKFKRHTDRRCTNPRTIFRNCMFDSFSSTISPKTAGSASADMWLSNCSVLHRGSIVGETDYSDSDNSNAGNIYNQQTITM